MKNGVRDMMREMIEMIEMIEVKLVRDSNFEGL